MCSGLAPVIAFTVKRKMASTKDISTAILLLEQSTTGVENQINILLANREYLKSFQACKAEADAKEKAQLRTYRLESQNLKSAVEESIAALSGDSQRVEKGLADRINGLETSLIDSLRQDDRILQQAAGLSQVDLINLDDGQKLRNRVTKLSQTLSQLTQDELRCRLDRNYLECLASSSQIEAPPSTVLEEQQVRQDLRSLHVEISDVATMAVTQEFREPLLSMIDAERSRRNTRTQDSLGQINTAVANIADSAETYIAKLEVLHSYRDAVALLGEEIRAAGSSQMVEQATSDTQGVQDGESTALKSVLERWDISSSSAAGIQRDLCSRKQKISQDLEKATSGLHQALQMNLPTSSIDIDVQQGQRNDLDVFEQEIQQLRDVIDAVDLSYLGKDDPHKARLLARWQ